MGWRNSIIRRINFSFFSYATTQQNFIDVSSKIFVHAFESFQKKNTPLRRFQWSTKVGKRSIFLLFEHPDPETQFSVLMSFFLSIFFVVSWFTHMVKFSIGKVFLIIASLLWLSKFLKIAIGIDFYLFPNSCHSKTTGLSCSIKKFNPFFRKHDKIFFEKRSTHFLIIASLSFNLETS